MKKFLLSMISASLLVGCIQKSDRDGSFSCKNITDKQKGENTYIYNSKTKTIRLVSIDDFVANMDFKASDTGNQVAWTTTTEVNIISFFLDKKTMKLKTIAVFLDDKSETIKFHECRWIN